MSDLIEMLRLSNPKGTFGKDMHEAADALEAKDQEIKRLTWVEKNHLQGIASLEEELKFRIANGEEVEEHLKEAEAQLESLQNKWANRELSEPDSQARIAQLEGALHGAVDAFRNHGLIYTAQFKALEQALGERE